MRRISLAALAVPVALLASGCGWNSFHSASHRTQYPPLLARGVAQDLADWQARLGNGPQPSAALRDAVATRARNATSGTALTLTRLRFYGGSPHPGVRVDLRADDPALALLEARRIVQSLGTLHDRVYVSYRLRDAHGGTLWIGGWTQNEGFVGTTPLLDECQPIVHSEAVSTSPPPACPEHLPPGWH
jgi:hypothetical protein